jgi:hypothetical protein
MIKRRAEADALPYSTCCHTFRDYDFICRTGTSLRGSGAREVGSGFIFLLLCILLANAKRCSQAGRDSRSLWASQQ